MVDRNKENFREALSIKKRLARSSRGVIKPREKRLGMQAKRETRPWRHLIKRALGKEKKKVKEDPKKTLTQEELLAQIKQETHPDRLKEAITRAEKLGLQVDKKDKERSDKMERVRQSIKDRVSRISQSKISAAEKDAFKGIQTGHVESGVKEMATIGREGAVGNNIAEESGALAKEAKALQKETGKHYGSVMQQMLREAAPGNSIDTQKRQDKSDQNLEGRTTKETTGKQMWKAFLEKRTDTH